VWGNGFVNIKDLKKLNVQKIDLYMVKYLTKDIDNRLFGRRRFLYSNNVSRPYILTDVLSSAILKLYNKYELIYKKTIDFSWGATLYYSQYNLIL